MLPTIGLFVWLFYFFVIVSSKQALGTSTTAASPKPRDGPKLQFPRGMQSQVAASASQSTSIASLNPVAIPSVTVIQNATITIQPACSLVTSMLSFCNSISPRFSTFNYVDQTSCLCYPNITAWSPGIFDDAVATCVNLVSATLSEYSRFTSFEGFCTKPGLQATSNSGETQVTSQSIGVITQSIGVPTQSIVTSTTGPTSSPTPTAGSGAPQPIQNLTKGDKIGIGVGGSAALGLAGYCLYLALFAKKRLLHPAGSEEFGPASSPQNETIPSSSEKNLSKSPEIQHAELPLPKRVTI